MANLPAKNATARVGQMGVFAQAGNHQVMSGWLNYPVYQDATGTPVKSPQTLTTTPLLLNIPAAAATITILAAVAVRIGDNSGINAAGAYMLIPANVPVTVPVVTPSSNANDTTGQLWIAADSTGGACSFYFGCV